MDEIAKKILNDVNLEEIAPRVKNRSRGSLVPCSSAGARGVSA
jgi:hypothetical protein